MFVKRVYDNELKHRVVCHCVKIFATLKRTLPMVRYYQLAMKYCLTGVTKSFRKLCLSVNFSNDFLLSVYLRNLSSKKTIQSVPQVLKNYARHLQKHETHGAYYIYLTYIWFDMLVRHSL